MVKAERRHKTLSEVQEFISGYSEEVIAIVLKLRKLVLDTAPEAIEQLDSSAKMIAYGFEITYKDTICVIMPLKAGVNLGFPRGAEMSDPSCLLTGTGKRARHIRVASLDEAENKGIRILLQAAVSMTKK
jgi:hypothetical protein